MIKTIIFDLGNVIVSFDHERIVRRLAEYCDHPPAEIFRRAVASATVADYNLGRISTDEFFASVAGALGLRATREDFCASWNCTFAPEPLVPESLIETLARRCRLLVLSDTNELHFDFIRENFPLLRHFEDFVVSHRVRAAKPAAEIFRRAVETAGCRPNECLFIDDVEANVEGARKAGLEALRFVSAAELEKDLRARGLL